MAELSSTRSGFASVLLRRVRLGPVLLGPVQLGPVLLGRVLLVPVLLLAACGSSARSGPVSTPIGDAGSPRSAPSACPADVAALVSRLGGGPATVDAFTAPDGARACRLGVRAGPVVTITVDTAPQPYTRLEREIVETGQVFGARRMTPAPVHVDRLGLDASWFPGLGQVLTASSQALVGVGVVWAGQPASRRRAVAVTVARRVIAEP